MAIADLGGFSEGAKKPADSLGITRMRISLVFGDLRGAGGLKA